MHPRVRPAPTRRQDFLPEWRLACGALKSGLLKKVCKVRMGTEMHLYLPPLPP